VTVDLKAKYDEIEVQRLLHIAGLDAAIEAKKMLHELDEHLVANGFQKELQLPPVSPGPPRMTLEEIRAQNRSVAVVEASEPPAAARAEDPPPVPQEPSVPETKTTKLATGKRYTDLEKAEAVRLADELGSDAAAARQLGTTSQSICNWRNTGHGKKPQSISASSNGGKSKETATGPSVRCPNCKTGVPIEGDIDEVSRATAMREHYKTSPKCREALAKARR
jgi:transposase-like protein